MAIRHSFSTLAFILAFSALAHATPLAVNNVAVEIPVGPGTTDATETDFTSPQVLLGGNPDIGVPGYDGDTIFLKFRPDDLSDVESIKSLNFSI
ncbi:MAG TPA: hypothetical protein VHC90_19890, partial [Bryobacteraceae bacterium]|nr:hypothetical protein [Bryobacteraceae bacterium]